LFCFIHNLILLFITTIIYHLQSISKNNKRSETATTRSHLVPSEAVHISPNINPK